MSARNGAPRAAGAARPPTGTYGAPGAVMEPSARIDPEFRKLIPPLDPDQLRGLEDSIRHWGNRDSIVVWAGHNILLDGHQRVEICRRLGIPLKLPAEIDLPSRAHAELWVVENQLRNRRNLTDDQRALLMVERYERLSKLAKEERARKAASVRWRDGECLSDASSDKHRGSKRDTRAEVARGAKLSERRFRYAVEVKKAPDLAEKVFAGQLSLVEAMREKRTRENRAMLESISTRKAKEIAGLYDVIVIDPPWPVQGQIPLNEIFISSELPHYPLMTLEQIKTEIGAYLAEHLCPDAFVFLWTTQKFLPDALKLIEAWGLKYRGLFTWHKRGGPKPLNQPIFNSEHAIYACRGAPEFVDTKAFWTCFKAPRGAHSEKPEVFYEMLRRVTAGRRLDMFNRRKIKGFDGWGYETADEDQSPGGPPVCAQAVQAHAP
jgi:N6-adenosine-specific RNA methylase IME4